MFDKNPCPVCRVFFSNLGPVLADDVGSGHGGMMVVTKKLLFFSVEPKISAETYYHLCFAEVNLLPLILLCCNLLAC